MKYLVGNFKNKLKKEDIIKYNEKLGSFHLRKVKLVIAPSFTFLAYFNGEGYSLASQDISSLIDKTVTGEITGEQLKSMNVEYVIIGHSERREYKHEINIDFINKINNAHLNNLKVIYCIGETLKDYEEGNTYQVLEKEISEVLNNVDIKDIMIAYEPIYAIGTGVVPKIEEIKDTIDFIKDTIREKYDTTLQVLYGGSVNDENIKELNTLKNIDGFLVGGASLDVDKVKCMLLEMEE